MRPVSGSTFRSIWQPTPQKVQVVFVLASARSSPAAALEELLVDGPRRARREAAAAQLAVGVQPRLAPGRHDARLAAAALERERRALHDLLRVAHAAVAEDAGVRVVAHEPVAVLVRLALRVGQHERRLGPVLGGHVDELVRPAGGRRVEVLAEEHLGERLAQALDRAVRGDDHALAHARRAGGQRPGRALDGDDAHAAAAVRLELVVVAERGDQRPVPRGRVDEQLASGAAPCGRRA